ncbi:hypothetical protein PoB_000117700 [Plakobranchus ocellatus]|uniref:PHD-type domain-containing protein n=1 Tax=Plakobranchus ocellatus TaxID=259542 RepID=A0AAV3XW40_9GAST|nr:hypothetical protein PoB_000117700 [Plakobranchus ocellatus]
MRPKRATPVKKNVGLCPCIFCREISSEESSSTECSSCKGWIHWRCVPMTDDLLKEWGEGDLPFMCRMCAFDNGAYSASKALERHTEEGLILSEPSQGRATNAQDLQHRSAQKRTHVKYQ